MARPSEDDARPRRLGGGFDDFEELARLDSELWTRTQLVFKPYWIADCRVVSAERSRELPPSAPVQPGRSWFLVDATRGFVSATITADEARRLLAAPTGDPLAAHHATELRLVTSRCPECGVDLPPEDCGWVLVCSNCHQGLEVGEAGLRRVAYTHRVDESSPPGEPGWLPFWRFSFALTAEGQRLQRLEALLPGLADAGPSGPWLWVPAMRLLGRPLGDETFLALVRWIHAGGRTPAIEDARLPTTSRLGRTVPVSLPEHEARAVARSVLGAALPARALSQVPAEMLRRRIGSSTLELEEGRLVLVAATLERQRWHLPGLVAGVPAAAVAAEAPARPGSSTAS